jgi:D-3-phosphoglycerate dehydrogenase
MSDYLLEGAVSNAINAPSLTAEEAKTLDPYLQLVKQIASFAGQVTDEEVQSIQITFEGDAKDLPPAPLVQTAVQAALAPRLSSINMVNALEVAKERGIQVSHTKSEAESDYVTRVSVAIKTPTMTRDVKGTLIAGKLPRVIEVKSIAVESDLEGDMLYVTNQDKPGLIGAVGTIFAEHGINIATFHLGRTGPGQDAIALVKVDAPVPEEVVAKLRTLDYLDRVVPLRF